MQENITSLTHTKWRCVNMLCVCSKIQKTNNIWEIPCCHRENTTEDMREIGESNNH